MACVVKTHQQFFVFLFVSEQGPDCKSKGSRHVDMLILCSAREERATKALVTQASSTLLI